MATITKIRRVANPGTRGRRRFRALRNKKGRFVKSSRATKTRASRSRPRRKHNAARRVVRRSRPNPVLIELSSLAGLNPRKRRTTKVAKRKYRKTSANTRRRRSNPRPAVRRRRKATVVARPVRRRRNPVAAAPVRRRRRYTRRRAVFHRRRHVSNPRRRRYSNSRRRRNPLFNIGGTRNYAEMIGGGLVGVAAAKYIPTIIPASLTASMGSSPIISIVISAAGAFAAGYLAKRFIGTTFGDAVLFGGLMQTGSLILTAFAPAPLNTALALSGLGDIMPGWFAVPQNSVTNRPPMTVIPSGGKGVSGFAPGGFGFRRR